MNEQMMDPTMFHHVNNINKLPVHLEFESLPSEATTRNNDGMDYEHRISGGEVGRLES